MDYVIEDGIPCPSVYRTGLTAVLRTMEPGQSVFVAQLQHRVSGITSALHRRLPSRRYRTRTVEGGTRIWRTE